MKVHMTACHVCAQTYLHTHVKHRPLGIRGLPLAATLNTRPGLSWLFRVIPGYSGFIRVYPGTPRPPGLVPHMSAYEKMAVDKLADPGWRRKLIAQTLCDPQLLAVTRDLDCFEVFAGVGSVARAAADFGHNSATFDKADNEAHDICITDGFTMQGTFS